MRRLRAPLLVSAIVLPLSFAAVAAGPRVDLKVDEAARRVDVTVDGKPFTSYIFPTTIKKPVLYPLRTAQGTVVTRGFPLDPRPHERVDHPHQVGLWFNHGDVSGFDFWNNSDAIGPDRAPKMGTIVQRRIVEAKGGAGEGVLVTESDWVTPDHRTLLHERTRYVFHATADTRAIDRITTLTAGTERVVFTDNKEGVIGMRVAHALEQPATQPDIYTDASGKPSTTKTIDNEGVTGLYTSSEGLTGDAVWGTRARWTMLTGTVDGEPVTLAILDHPGNPGYPTYWHARGYGLFAANPMGEKVFTEGKRSLDVTVEPGQSLTFRHRILILHGTQTPAALNAEFARFKDE